MESVISDGGLSRDAWLAGMELGGTKAVVGLGDGRGRVLEQIRFPTTSPRATMDRAWEWLGERCGNAGPPAVGIATFGPIQLDPHAPDYGVFLTTPKRGWQGFSLVESLRAAFPECRLALETDVNAALLAELRYGAAKGMRDVVYLTIGTGIGAGICANGRLVQGTLHPEMGHLRVPRHADDSFAGACPYHRDCWEGLASGVAMEQRWGVPAKELPPDHPAWEMEAWYLAQGILAAIAMLAPQRVILGGGVPQVPGLVEATARALELLANGYFHAPGARLCLPALAQDAGLIGAMELIVGDDV
jgi:fructokinase